MPRSPQLSFPLGVLVGVVVGTGCWHRSTSHCANLSGDQTCAERGDGALCDACLIAGDGCTDERPADECYFAGEKSTTSDTTSDGGTTAEETTLEPSTESGVTTGPEPCVSDEECVDAAAPFCGASGECVACDGTDDPDGACANLDPTVPLCANGVCVQCTEEAQDECGGKTPLCDDTTNICVACTEHDQCGEAACNFYTGACLPADAVVHVGLGLEFADLTTAAASFAMGTEGTIIVHPNIYTDSVTVNGGRVLAFLANDGVLPVWDNQTMFGPQLSVNDSVVFLDNLELTGNAMQPALIVSGGQAWVDHSRIINNDSGGILAQNGAELTLRNSFVGSVAIDTIAVEVNGASAQVLYSTLTTSTFGSTPALACSPFDAVEIRNSIIVSQGGSSPDELSCRGASVVNSATEANVGEFDLGWFVDHNNGDLSLTATGATTFADIAQWQTGDPLTDIDGDPRPTIDGTADYAGADVPVP